MSRSRIDVVVASAGSGKTTRIVRLIGDEVRSRPPTSLMATTFTIKAADELIERARAGLFRDGRHGEAAELLGARFGTVNAVCGRIVSEFALDLGRSPSVEVMDEDAAERTFKTAAERVIGTCAAAVNGIADAFGHSEPSKGKPLDWRSDVHRLVSMARSNGMDAAALRNSAERSVRTFMALLPSATTDGLDNMLRQAVANALGAVPATPSSTAIKGGLAVLRSVHLSFQRKEAPNWPDWVRLSKVDAAKKDGDTYNQALFAVRSVASRHGEHPRLHSDCETWIRHLFDCAIDALEDYRVYKEERGLVDFTDQETEALRVLERPDLASRLSESVERVFVDEFQDSSPIQVAIFTALARIVDQSTWVGDPKQAIYAFRGADTRLTQAAFRGAAAGDRGEILSKSWRSRSDIVRFVNAAFVPAFERMGLPEAETAFSDTGRNEAGFSGPALARIRTLGKNKAECAASLAASIAKALQSTEQWPVGRGDNAVGPLAPGNVAVLCRSHADVGQFASALVDEGLKVAVERSGLLGEPHVQLAIAAYRWVADRTDRLALAEMARFYADDPDDDAWLAAAAEDDREVLVGTVPISAALDGLRRRTLELSPAELLDAVLCLPEFTERCARWGDAAGRMEDLEALRGAAERYEDACNAGRLPATPSGFVAWLAEDDPKKPMSTAPDAVRVMTYHGAKGLEWPFVVLTGLGAAPKPRLFEPTVEFDGEIDWVRPLQGRWIRLWPWPYGGQETGTGLRDAALQSDIGQVAERRAREEETRLLYVGCTRARDHLVFAGTDREVDWLKVLDGESGDPVVTLPAESDMPLVVGGREFECRLMQNPAAGDRAAVTTVPSFVSEVRSSVARRPLRLRPSSFVDGRTWQVAERIVLGPRLRLMGNPDMAALGEALHSILAVDDGVLDSGARLIMASDILKRWRVSAIKAEDALEAAHRLSTWLAASHPGSRIRREIPIVANRDGQVVSGQIDLLVESPGRAAVIDHKSFPGAFDTWDSRVAGHGPQLGLYADALVAAGVPAPSLFVHMPLVGAIIRLETQVSTG